MREALRPKARLSRARLLGRLAQGVALGFLLFLALLELQAQAGDITPFKYQGF